MGLSKYQSKRNFKSTPEPAGSARPKKPTDGPQPLRFVVQLHEASRRHYDLRLELDGTMKSWAVPKGPSLDPLERRLAVEVEDHPMEYNDFEGVIPRGNYGAGVVMIWDEGHYKARSLDFPAKDEADALRRGYAKGHMTFILEGSKLRGEFALIRLARSDGQNWLLVKKHDSYASREEITHADRSVRSGRTLGEIAANAPKEGRLWQPGKAEAKSPSRKPREKKSRAAEKKGEEAPSYERAQLPARFRGKNLAENKLPSEKPVLWKAVSRLPPQPKAFQHAFYDGYRALLGIESDGSVRLLGKTGLSLGARFPRLMEELEGLPGPLLLDGLVVPLDADGQIRRRGRLTEKTSLQHAFVVYDLLHADGFQLSSLKLAERLEALEALKIKVPALRWAARLDPEQTELPEVAIGILQRESEQPYHGPSAALSCRGPLQRRPVASKGAPAELARPQGTRHEVSHRTARPGVTPQVALTNLSKIYWPQEKISKGQLIDYYRAVAPVMLPHLRDRPQSLHRHPNGILGTAFFQKEVSGAVPGWMETATIGSGRSGKTVTYALCQTEADLLFLANMGCIEINAWLSRVTAINAPDYVVFDLDPGQIAFEAVIDVARTVKKLLDKLGAPAYCKTSGSRGLHIYVPITGAESFDAARHFAQQLSAEVHRLLPDITSLERSPERRTKLIYLDYLQNRIGQTMATVYSVRPKPKATVSTPLRWSEVKHGLDPQKFTIATVPERIAKLGDLWADMAKAAVDLSDCQKALDALTEKTERRPQPGHARRR